MRLLILAHATDIGAMAVAHRLRPRLGSALVVLQPEWLGQAAWSQRLDEQGRAHTRLCWPGHDPLDSDQDGLVWNRVQQMPQAAFRASSAKDRDYAGAELHALVASWLAGLGTRVSPPMRPHACVAPALHHLHWAAPAPRCGLVLACDGEGMGTGGFSVLHTPLGLTGVAAAPALVDGACSDLAVAAVPAPVAWPASLLRGCSALAAALGLDLLGLHFAGTAQAPRLHQVDALPPLRLPGQAAAVAAWLLQRLALPSGVPQHSAASRHHRARLEA